MKVRPRERIRVKFKIPTKEHKAGDVVEGVVLENPYRPSTAIFAYRSGFVCVKVRTDWGGVAEIPWSSSRVEVTRLTEFGWQPT